MTKSSRGRPQLLVCVVSACVALAPMHVSAGTMTGAATEWTQLGNFVTICMGLVQQMQASVALASQVKSWTTTLKGIDSPQDVVGMLQGIQGILGRTRSLAFQAESLAARTGAFTTQWRAAHPGEKDPSEVYGAPGPGGVISKQADERAFREVDESLQKAVERAYYVLDVHADEAADDAVILEKLTTKMQSVEGQRQVGMMTNELLLKILQAIMKLGETCDALAYVTGEYASSSAQKSQYERQMRNRAGRYTGRFRGDPYGFGGIE